MLVVYFLFSLLYFNCKCEINIVSEDQVKNPNLIKCITDTVKTYFSEHGFTYVDMDSDDNELLKAIHSTIVTSVAIRQPATPSSMIHNEYLITAKTVNNFLECFKDLRRDPWWNPSTRFLIVITSLEENELKKVFDELLKRHVIDVLLVNGTDNAHLYTYNPFDNYACGKYYSDIMSYGWCSDTIKNIFANKLVTGLRNCTLRATVQHLPPFSINLTKVAIKNRMSLGTEQYIFQLLSERERFNIDYSFYYDERYTTVSSDMKVVGPLAKVQNNETEVMFGSLFLVSSRTEAFTYLHGYMDFVDELLFFVKRASLNPAWKNVYLEFQPLVWWLLLLIFLIYSTLIIVLVRAEDKTEIMLKLLQNLLSHGCNIPYRPSVKCVFIIWVCFAYLMSSLYQSSLVSLTTHPTKEFQVSTELEIYKHRLKPCINTATFTYILSETKNTAPMNYGGQDSFEDLKLVGKSKDLFALVHKSLFEYNKKSFYDEYGRSPVYYLKRPYARFIYAFFFYKGFPVSDRMREIAIRLRENGLVEKSLKDHYYQRKIKFHFHDKEFQPRLYAPWFIYFLGCVLAMMTFVAELLSKYYEAHT